MSFIQATEVGFHEGEKKMQSLLHVPERENVTSPFLTPGAEHLLYRAPLLAVGVLDQENRPWSTILGGEPGFARSLGASTIALKANVGRKYDPVIETIIGDVDDEREVKEKGSGRLISALTIDLATRRRVKLNGKIIASAIGSRRADEQTTNGDTSVEMQMLMKIDQSLGNCPKYLNIKQITPHPPKPQLVSDSAILPNEAIQLLAKADLFFVSSSFRRSVIGTNHRGGPPGFVRVVTNHSPGAVLAYPEYSGNRLYQTLGNLLITPEAGFVFPDFDTGDVLYISGTTEILIGNAAASLLPRSNLAVIVKIAAARFVREGLPFRGKAEQPSPYNPKVRFLASERKAAVPDAQSQSPSPSQNSSKRVYAKLLKKTPLTPTIARFRFRISSDPEAAAAAAAAAAAGRLLWTPGQHVALAFADELSTGYSHMRDSDPTSLNDDFVRTFTISSSAPPAAAAEADEYEFDITIRNVGVATAWLFRQHERMGLELPVVGFGGDFTIVQEEAQKKGEEGGDGEAVGFVAGGIGITPLLAQLGRLDVERLVLFWAVGARDLGLVEDTLRRWPGLAVSMRLFVSGDGDGDGGVEEEMTMMFERMGDAGVQRVFRRRMCSGDFSWEDGGGGQRPLPLKRWYVCTGLSLRRSVLEWLDGGGREVVFEDFDY